MSTVTERTPKVSRLSDPNLAFLASRAAIELDRIFQGRPKGTEAVTELGSLLKSATEGVPRAEGPAALWDPGRFRSFITRLGQKARKALPR